MGFFYISVQHKIKCIYIRHVSRLNYSSTFPVREAAQTVFTRQYFSRLQSPSDTFFAPKCNMNHQLQLDNFYHTG